MEDYNYKKKYEDALSRAREMCAMPTDKATMEYVFPELKESEDEKVRKQLLDFVHRNALDSYSDRDKWVAYLEKLKDFDKQLEQAYKTADEVQYKRGYEDALASLNKANEEAIREIGNEMKLPIIGQRKTDGGIIGKMQEQINKLTPSQVTKKSDKVEWSDEDQDFFGLLEGYLEFDYDLSMNDKANTLDWLKSVKQKLS